MPNVDSNGEWCTREIRFYRRQAWGRTIYRIDDADRALTDCLARLGRKSESGSSFTPSQWAAFTELCFLLQGELPTLAEIRDPKLEAL
jgi:hypothetical protein